MRVLALEGFSPTCSCFIFPLDCLAGPVTSMRVGPTFLLLSSSPFVSQASCRCGYRHIVISVCGLSTCCVRPSCVHSLAGSFDFLPLGFPVSFPSLLPLGSACVLSSCRFLFLPRRSLASVRSALSFSRLSMPTRWFVASYWLDGSLGWFVVGSFGCLGVLPSLQSSSTGSFGLRDLLPGPVCLSRMLSGFSVLLSFLSLLVFACSGSSCSPIGWPCCGFSCLFRLLSPNPPSLA